MLFMGIKKTPCQRGLLGVSVFENVSLRMVRQHFIGLDT